MTATTDERELRSAFGTFITGVTVVTTVERDGTPRGFTANSFASVSLDPPLLLVCIAKNAASCSIFAESKGFAVNILSEAQKDVANVFASKHADKFATVAWRLSAAGHPIIDHSAAWFDCKRYGVFEAGDHIILLASVEAFHHTTANTLGYARGGYFALSLEQDAATAAASADTTVVGAILECDGRVLLLKDETTGGYTLAEVGRAGRPGSVLSLRDALSRMGMDAAMKFVFAVFETAEPKAQFIYYRGEAEVPAALRGSLFEPKDIPWEHIHDAPTRTMLRRYISERELGSFGVYSGDDQGGQVCALSAGGKPGNALRDLVRGEKEKLHA